MYFFVDSAAVPQDQGINTHEMDSLKAQIASLASRLSAIDGSVIGISKVVGNLMMEGHKKKYEVDMKNENCGKKRRRIPPSSVELSENGCQPNRGQSSQQYCTSYSSDSDDTYDEISESYSVSSDEQPGATKLTDLPRGSELRQMEVLNCDFFRMSSADLLEDDLSIEFDDFLGLPAGQILEVNVSEDKPNNENISTSPVQRHDGFLAADVAVVTKSSPAIQLPFSLSKASDMTDILQYLSRDMQERFVDKLAESVGSHYAKLMANTTTPSVPTVNIPAAPAMSMNNYSTQFLQQMQNQQCQSTFQQFEQQNVLNSNNGSNYESYSQITPSMALPLASAALCSLIAAHCNGSNANSATCLAVKAATTAAGVTCHNGVCLPTFCNSANV